MAPNYHPEFAKALQTNQFAFYKKKGLGSGHLDDAHTAVTRKTSQLMENSRMGGSMIPAGRSSTITA